MQEIREDGSELLTDSVSKDQIMQAIDNPINRSVHIHKPGSTFYDTISGKKFTVLPDGRLKMLDNGKSKTARRQQKAARRRNRP